MRESDAEKEVGIAEWWIGNLDCECTTTTPEVGDCLRCDLKAIRKRLLEYSLGCYHRKITYSRFGEKYISECNHCGKRVRLTKEQFDKSVKGTHGT
jgi:hypothetical protein